LVPPSFAACSIRASTAWSFCSGAASLVMEAGES
jgi:hypothetical protein